MPKRVAITIAGAVSLGSYEAGVTYELLEAFRTHNELADREGRPDDKIYVDVITGASAGGMTAAMLAEWLTFFGDAMQHPAENPLYRAWVESISIWGLVRLRGREKAWSSLLSSDLVTSIGNKMLVDSMKLQPTGAHACLEPGAPLRIGVALTNLDGINYRISIDGNPDGGFNYTHSADRRLFTVRPDIPSAPVVVDAEGHSHPSTWAELRAAAVACGAFPFAFRPQALVRTPAEYITESTPAWPPDGPPQEGTTYVDWNGGACRKFPYTDGGVLQNQPLGVAKNLVEASVGDRLSTAAKSLSDAAFANARRSAHQDADQRLYCFISPNEVKSSAEDLDAENISLWKIGPDVLRTYLRQATFHDWIMAETMNQKIRLLDTRAVELVDELNVKAVLDVEALRIASQNMLQLLYKQDQLAIDDALERLGNQYQQLCGKILVQSNVEVFLASIATLEAAAQLNDRDEMHIVAVLADGKNELAGSGIAAFVGFFAQRFRDHDYNVGRNKARDYMRRSDVAGILNLDIKTLEAVWNANKVPDPKQFVKKVPLSLSGMLLPGIPALSWLVFLRTWPVLVLVLAFGVAAHHFHRWPF